MKKLITLCMAVFVLCFGFYPNALSASEAAEAYETGDVARLNLTPDIDNVEKVYLSHAFGFDSGISDYGYETEKKSEIYAILHYIDSLEPVWDGDEIHAYDTHGFIILIIYNGQKYKALDWSIGRLNVSGSDGTGAQFALSEDKITPLIRLGEAMSTGEITVGDDVFSQSSDWAVGGITAAEEAGLVPKAGQIGYKSFVTRAELYDLAANFMERFGTGQTGVGAPVLEGKTETEPSPYDRVTREEAAKILCGVCRGLGMKAKAADPEFADSGDISDWAREGVGAMAAMGVFGGDENGNFRPKDNIKKEELIIALLRIYYAGGFNIPRP